MVIIVSLGLDTIILDLIRLVVEYSPRVALAILTLTLGWVIGRLSSFFVNKLVGKMGLESSFRRVSVGRAVLRVGYTPGRFFGVLIKAVVYLFAFLFALELLAIPFLTAFVQAIMGYLPHLFSGALVLVGGFVLVDWVGETIERGTSATFLPALLSWLVRGLLYFVVITMALAEIQVDVTILYILAQALAWSIAIAVGVALGWNLKDRMGPWLDKAFPKEKKRGRRRQ